MNSSYQSKEKVEILITDFEKEMDKKSVIGSEHTGGQTPNSIRSRVKSISGSQLTSNSLETVFMNDYINNKDSKWVVEEKIN